METATISTTVTMENEALDEIRSCIMEMAEFTAQHSERLHDLFATMATVLENVDEGREASALRVTVNAIYQLYKDATEAHEKVDAVYSRGSL